jgi:hypothetical protein
MITAQIIAIIAVLIFSLFVAVRVARIWASVKSFKSSHKQENIVVTNRETGKSIVVPRHYNEREQVSRKLMELAG